MSYLEAQLEPGGTAISRTAGAQGAADNTNEAGCALQLHDVGVRFGGISALSRVSFSLADGEFCGLIGANGAGKTTLFDVISGLRAPTNGRITMHGTDITRQSAHKRARAGLQRTFQRVQIFGWLTVEENLLAATEWQGGGGGVLADLVGSPSRRRRELERRERAREVLHRCGLTKIAERRAASLPIGTARLVELARALMGEPSILLLDEPASGLDDAEAKRLGDLVTEVAATDRTAVLLVEHDVGFVMERCQRIITLQLGEVLADGTPEEIRSNPLVLDAYLGATT